MPQLILKIFKFLSLVFVANLLLNLSSSAQYSYNLNKEIHINVPSRTLQLRQNGHLVREYPVGVGFSKQMQTPPGKYKVERKIINPIWEHPYKAPGQSQIGSNPKNPLGNRWIGFHSEGNGVYGIHGTNEPSSIGKFVSHGCVRMLNSDVEELFELVDFNTPVFVTYNRYSLSRAGNKITIEVFPDPYKLQSLSSQKIVQEVRKLDPFAVVDLEMLNDAISDGSDSAVYEIAEIRQQFPSQFSRSVPFADPAGFPGMYSEMKMNLNNSINNLYGQSPLPVVIPPPVYGMPVMPIYY